MRKTVAATAIVSILAIASAIWVIAEYAADQAENQTRKVSITQFNWTSNWGPGAVGTLSCRSFNVTLHNLGENVTGLTLQIKLSDNSSELWSLTWLDYQKKFSPNVTFSLRAGEICEFQGAFMTSLNDLQNAQGEVAFAVMAMLGDAVLDELQLDSIGANNVQITEFTTDQSLGGSFIDCKFNVTVRNFGPNNVSDVLLEVTAFDNEGTEVKQYTEQLGTLDSGEERRISGLISIYVFLQPRHFQLQCALKWENGTILDEQTLP